MAVLVTMPKLSDTMEEGGIFSWLISEGEAIEEGDGLVEIETDKATMEYPSPESGYLLKIIVAAGEQVDLGAPIAVMGASKDEEFSLESLLLAAEDSAEAHSGAEKAADTSTAESKAQDQRQALGKQGDISAQVGRDLRSRLPDLPQLPDGPDQQGGSSGKESDQSRHDPAKSDRGRQKISPLARKLAQAARLDTAGIEGSGLGGRVVRRDIERALKTPSQVDQPPKISEVRRVISASTAVPVVPAPSDDGQRYKLSILRKSIAKNLLRSKQEVPHFYLTTRANMTGVIALREKIVQRCIKESIVDESRGGTPWKVSYNDIFVMAVSRALRDHRALRSSWQGDHILEHHDIHIAIAVALDDGLITPVIPHADRHGLLSLSRGLRSLIQQASGPKRGDLDLTSGVFTISNLGMTCVEEFAAVINPPQSAILAIGRMKDVPHWDGQQWQASKEVTLTLSCDHRVVDGLVGARFLDTLVALLEDPLMMLH